MKIYMTSDGLYIYIHIYIYQDLYDRGMAYIYQGLHDKWWLIYIKVYMTSDGVDISRFVWQVIDLYDKWWFIYIKVYIKSDIYVWQVMADVYMKSDRL